MKISKFTVNPLGENVYILWNDIASEAAIVDPGMMYDNERRAVDEFVDKNRLSVKMVLMTHLHFDHAASARYVADKYGAKIYADRGDCQLGMVLSQQPGMFGMDVKLSPLKADIALVASQRLYLDGEEIQVLATPGHTLGSVSFYIPSSGVVLVGDTLFCQSIGRTDLPGGDYKQIVNSIKKQLYTLPDETVVLPGHGDSTTICDEKRYNPFVSL